MGTLAVALVVIVTVIVASSFAFVALRRQRNAALRQPSATAHPHAPMYRQQAQHADYYRPLERKEATTAHALVGDRRDAGNQTLPHCPLCNAAVGFDDIRCPKCKHELKGT